LEDSEEDEQASPEPSMIRDASEMDIIKAVEQPSVEEVD
jgi:hypothetical protein